MVVDLARIVGPRGVSVNTADRFAYSRDCWPRDVIRARSGETPAMPECVVWPETPEEAARVLEWARRRGVPVVPFGAGSGVAGGSRPVPGCITLDLKRMRAIRGIDEANLRAEVEGGILGERLERLLNEKGYTLGHFPSSIWCSTLGGWLAARSAGQQSTLYGKIEDMCLGLEVVTPGEVRRCVGGPRPEPGSDLNALVIGSEGTLAAITAAVLRIRPLPETRQLRGYRFPTVEAGLTAMRRMLRQGLRPAVARLYDALDTFITKSGHNSPLADEEGAFDVLASRARGLFDDLKEKVALGDRGRELGTQVAKTIVRGTVRAVLGTPLVLNRAARVLPSECLFIVGFEGQRALVTAQMSAARTICEAEGAEDLGPEPGQHWLRNRHNVSFKQSKAYDSGVFTDTMEVASTWDRLVPMYKAVREAMSKDAFVMAHFSHAYPEGCSIYFTFAGAGPELGNAASALERYDRLWKNALTAVSEAGGTISHHHGVGILKAEAMSREHGPGGMKLLRALKQSFDPAHIMNPTKLGLLTEDEAHSQPPRLPSTRPTTFPPEIVAAIGERNLMSSAGRTIVRPPDEGSLAAVLRVANARGLSVSTDQTGFRSPLGATQIDLSRLEGVVRLGSPSLFVEVEAGVRVERLETMLRRHGLTLGYVHPRAAGRSVGAALARNLLIRRGIAAGDLSDLCFAVRGLLANGAPVETRPVPRSATGPELDRAFVGAEGRWGIITRATLRIAAVPQHRRSVAYAFESIDQAVECGRLALRRGVRPAAGRVLTDGRAVFELIAQSEPVLKAEHAIVSSSANGLGGTQVDAEDLAVGGKFDAVVEIATLWDRAAACLRAMTEASGGEGWVDFMSPEGVTLVTRVADREGRLLAARAGQTAGGRVVAGLRTRIASDEGAEAPQGAYDDVIARLSRSLDPAGVFRGR